MDNDNSGTLDIDEIVVAIRGPMNEFRSKLV